MEQITYFFDGTAKQRLTQKQSKNWARFLFQKFLSIFSRNHDLRSFRFALTKLACTKKSTKAAAYRRLHMNRISFIAG